MQQQTVRGFATDAAGLALGGTDPVSYFAPGGPAPGSRAISAVWRGATFWFASEANRARFEADPARHGPQLGGYCAFGLCLKQAVPGDPEVWSVRDGRLYLNASRAVRFVWHLVPGVVARAERNWALVRPRD